MVIALDYETWRSTVIEEMELADANTVEKGDRFVQSVLRSRYQLSEDDAINATASAGPGDKSVDAIHIYEADEGTPATALVVQGKYGSAGDSFSPYKEFNKFADGIQSAKAGHAPTDAIQQCASVLKNGGALTYLIATVDPLTETLTREVEDVRVLSKQRFEGRTEIQQVCLKDMYEELVHEKPDSGSLDLKCDGVAVEGGVFIGAANLVSVYVMLREYARSHNGIVDTIYDKNIRKWLGNRKGGVNAGITKTLQEQPERFISYNNGISLVAEKFSFNNGTLSISNPQIVNGCQTTRTLYDFMELSFAGIRDQVEERPEADKYRHAFMAFKVTAVSSNEENIIKEITRYSNKQNAVRGRDFLTLDDEFQRLKRALEPAGYFLEVQTGEYSVLPKAEKQKFPREMMIPGFDALRFYGAGVFGKPHIAFGRSGDFTPEGKEFDAVMGGIIPNDLLVPWIVARDAQDMGYSVGAKRNQPLDDHRNQTRFLFLYYFFRVAARVLLDMPKVEMDKREELYDSITRLRQKDSKGEPVYKELLNKADGIVSTVMQLAVAEKWFSDRNAFLKQQELLDEKKYVMASASALLNIQELSDQAKEALS